MEEKHNEQHKDHDHKNEGHHKEHHHEKNHSTHHEKHHESFHKEQHDSHEKFNWKKTYPIAKVLLIIFLLLIPISLSYYFRIQPNYLPAMDDHAKKQVLDFYKGEITKEVNKNFAYLSEQKKTELIQQKLLDFVKENEQSLTNDIDILSNNLRERFQDENGDTYLLAIDPYLQYQYTKNYVENGHVGNLMIKGESFLTLRGGRLPRLDRNRFHPWIMSKWHNFLTMFNKNISIMHSVFLFPVLLGVLAMIPAFFLSRKISGGNLGGVIGASIIAVHAGILSRTVAGFSDTDIQNVFWPLMVMWLIVEAWYAKNNKIRYTAAGLAGLAISIYYMAWPQGWWFTFIFIFGSLVIYLFYIAISKSKNYFSEKNKNLWKFIKDTDKEKSIMITIIYSVTSFLMVVFWSVVFFKKSIFDGVKDFFSGLLGPLNFLQYQQVGISTIWPNVKTTVAELNNASIVKVINAVGGSTIFLLALLGIALGYYVIKKHYTMEKIFIGGSMVWYFVLASLAGDMSNVFLLMFLIWLPIIVLFIMSIFSKNFNIDPLVSILLTVFITGTFVSASRGIRFIALLSLFVALALGVFSQKIFDFVSNLSYFDSQKYVKIVVKMLAVVCIFWLVIISTNVMDRGWAQAKGEVPSMNDAWYDTLKTIQENSEDAIITSWWDFGHWFYSISERKVTFDGGNQGKRIHWVGKSLLTGSEKESVNILRMLNCDQNNAYFNLKNFTGDSYKAIKIVNEILNMTKSEARKTLESKGLTTEQIDSTMNSVFCEDLLQQYYIASEDMIGKAGVWAHFGSWDFDKAYMFNTINSMNRQEGIKALVDDFGLEQAEAEKTYKDIKDTDGDKWISPWPSFVTQSWLKCKNQDGIVACPLQFQIGRENGKRIISNGVVIDPNNYNSTQVLFVVEGTQKKGVIYSQVTSVFDGNVTVYDGPEDSNLGVIYNKNTNSILVSDPLLVNSIFTRMFFFEGAGLDYFKLIKKSIGVDGQAIYLYELNWTKTEDFWNK